MKTTALVLILAFAAAATPADAGVCFQEKGKQIYYPYGDCEPGTRNCRTVCDTTDVALTYAGTLLVGSGLIYLLSQAGINSKQSHIRPTAEMTSSGQWKYGLRAQINDRCTASLNRDQQTGRTQAHIELRW